ncbi:MAG: ABC transporter ATP-binding protein [Deltaproteobacteria bacterium]|jgi:iron(III) transport system ATP-binding protein|nr:ABC transporter ATP-binding protein [Deltaproteobacteria bacterium]
MTVANQSVGVSLQNITKKFGDTIAVQKINLEFAPGTLTTVLGPSGCGKTTILRIIGGLEIPTSGKILFGDEDVSHLSATNRDVGMVFQSYALFPHMNVGQNIGYGLKIKGTPQNEIKERVADVLKTVGLSGYESRYADEMSGGQQQRVAVARSLILEPKVLLFDEPLSNIDSKLRRSMREDIRKLQQETGITSIYVTHDQSEALAVSDDVIVMNVGKIEQMGGPEQLYRHPKNAFVATFIGDANILEGELIQVDGRNDIQLGEMTISAETVPDNAHVGKVQVAIRPEVVTMHADKGTNRMEGKVNWRSFVGSAFEYTIETSAGELFIVVTSTGDQFETGDTIYISVNNIGVAVLEPS